MPHHGGQTPPPQAWTTGLCGCTNDCGNCWMTFFCPCITFGRIAEIVDRGSPSCITSGMNYGKLLLFSGWQFHWIYSWMYRTKLRAQYNLPEEPCCDCCVHFCCECCSLCQQYRELKNRGFNMIIGWQLNMQRQGVTAATTQPPIKQEMVDTNEILPDDEDSQANPVGLVDD